MLACQIFVMDVMVGPNLFAVLTAAIAPGMALLSYFYLRHQYTHEINGLVLRSFIAGGILVFPIMVLQYAFIVEGIFTDTISQAVIASILRADICL